MQPKAEIFACCLAVLAVSAPGGVTAQEDTSAQPSMQQVLLKSAATGATVTTQPPRRQTLRLAVGQPLSRSGKVSLGLQGAGEDRGLDAHEINTAFAAQAQDPGGLAGARVSFHF